MSCDAQFKWNVQNKREREIKKKNKKNIGCEPIYRMKPDLWTRSLIYISFDWSYVYDVCGYIVWLSHYTDIYKRIEKKAKPSRWKKENDIIVENC